MEKEKILLEKIGYIVGHYGLDPVTSMISQRSLDISKMDIFKRHAIVAEIYEKRFLPFKELLAANPELEQVKTYISKIKVGAAPQHPDAIIGPKPDLDAKATLQGKLKEREEFLKTLPQRGGGTIPVNTWWTTGWRDNHFFMSIDSYHRVAAEIGYPLHGFTWNHEAGNIDAVWHNPVIDQFQYHWYPAANDAYRTRLHNERRAAYDTKLSQLNKEINELEQLHANRIAEYDQTKATYDAKVKSVSEIEFPAAVFNALVDKVNGLFKKLIP
jgi:hypothetical protein